MVALEAELGSASSEDRFPVRKQAGRDELVEGGRGEGGGRASRAFVDSRELALRFGDVQAAVAAGEVTGERIDGGIGERIDGEIGEVLAGRVSGRRTPQDITVAKLIGIGPQDLMTAETALALWERTSG
ncbi:hypothetical protein [Streptomyces sp. VRA16 Mangrove soil]|uniref:hypothetical protein n=1 Tax=Streptomyces sp. VRA16 Mangrove soil TaxID=2817434 RepID=UPI001A9FF536|nr:hypothetical protein [Streptomyces sp. VRA16 Mangrove soil]MBO1337702.1 hypothetical protein [Streptomyces sp. VRA16 Mangrove soil]